MEFYSPMADNNGKSKKTKEIGDLTQLSEQTGIQKQALESLILDGLIQYPITEEGMNNLAFLRNIWEKRKYIRFQLARYDKNTRLRLAETAEMTKLETYIFSRYLNQYIKRKKGERARKLSVKYLTTEVATYFGIENDKRDWLMKTILRIRARVRRMQPKVDKTEIL